MNTTKSLDSLLTDMTDFVANGSFASLKSNVKVYNNINYAFYIRLYDLKKGIGHPGQHYTDIQSYNFLKKSYLNGGEILICNVGSIGDCYIMPTLQAPATIAPNMLLLRPDTNQIDVKYLYYFLNSPQAKKIITYIVSQTSQPKFNKTDFKKILIPITKIETQHKLTIKIDAIFTEIDASLTEIKQLKKQLELYKQSVLNNIFSVFNQSHNNKSIEIVKLSNTVANPKQDIVDGPFGSNLKSIDYISSGTPVIKLQNIKANCFLEKNIDYIDINKATALSRHSYEPEDIIITKLGNPLGIACIMPSNFPNGIIVADLIRLRVNKNKINNKFLCYQINSPNVAQQFEKLTKGTTRPRVNLNLVRSIEVWIPSNEIQKHTAALLDNFFDDTNKIHEKIKKIEQQLISIKQSILKQAFEGNLV